MPPLPGLIGGSGTTASPVLDCEETINLVVEKASSKSAQGEGALLSTPGFTKWSAVAQVGARGFIFLADVPLLLGVYGSKLYKFDALGVATEVAGVLANDGRLALMVYNQQNGQVGISSGGSIYCYTVGTNTLSAALLAGGYTHIAFAGGWGFAFNQTTGTTVLSNVNDLSVWNVGIFFRRGVFYDPPQVVFADENNLVWTIGTETFEVRWNSGVGTQPWVALQGLVGPWGIASAYGFGLSSSGNFWVTRNAQGLGRFVVSSGGVPQPVGTYAIDAQIDKVAAAVGIDDAEVLLYDQGGHVSANVAFPKAQGQFPATPCTFSYDVTGETWTKRGFWNAQRAQWGLWAPRVHVLAYGKHLVGDRTTGTVWVLDQTSGLDVDGSGIRKIRRTPHYNSEHLRIPIDRVELLCAAGIGLQTGQGMDPQMMLRVSSDGGMTWDEERQCGLGAVGQYRTQIYWSQLGAPTDAVLEFSCAEPIPGFAIVGGWVNNTEPEGAGLPIGARRR